MKFYLKQQKQQHKKSLSSQLTWYVLFLHFTIFKIYTWFGNICTVWVSFLTEWAYYHDTAGNQYFSYGIK